MIESSVAIHRMMAPPALALLIVTTTPIFLKVDFPGELLPPLGAEPLQTPCALKPLDFGAGPQTPLVASLLDYTLPSLSIHV